jgi:hypothetical protein
VGASFAFSFKSISFSTGVGLNFIFLYPNVWVFDLSSRIYGGYNSVGLGRVNPEPFAYESPGTSGRGLQRFARERHALEVLPACRPLR